MNGSYLNHSKDTKEFAEGRDSKTNINPYPSATKEWLDWQLGYESCMARPMANEIIWINPLLMIQDYYDQYGFRI